MAIQLQRADETQRGNRSWKRDWFPYQSYVSVHQSSMASLEAEGLIHRDTLTFREIVTPSGALSAVNLRGRIECCDRVVIAVNKWLDTAINDWGQLVVRGNSYSYHAWVRGGPRREVLRYDDGHGELHRHFFDMAGIEVAVEPVTLDSLPRLDLIIREAVAIVRGTPIADLHPQPSPPA